MRPKLQSDEKDNFSNNFFPYDFSHISNRLVIYLCVFYIVFQTLNRMANISDDEKFQIGFPLEEEEKNHDENIKADISREHEPVKIATGDLGL